MELNWLQFKNDINKCYAGTTKRLGRVSVGLCLIMTNCGANQTCKYFKMLMKVLKMVEQSERDSLAMLDRAPAHPMIESSIPAAVLI